MSISICPIVYSFLARSMLALVLYVVDSFLDNLNYSWLSVEGSGLVLRIDLAGLLLLTLGHIVALVTVKLLDF